MICDIDPTHGEMQIEPMYGTGMTVDQYGWFCQVKDCDGYGGPTKDKPVRVVKLEPEIEQWNCLR